MEGHAMLFGLGATVQLDSLGHIVSTPVAVSAVLDVQCLCVDVSVCVWVWVCGCVGVGVGMLYMLVCEIDNMFV